MRDVFVRQSYINDLRAGLPISYLEFWFAQQDIIDHEAQEAFEGARPANVDPHHDIVEIRGHWEAGNCDYFVNAILQPDDTIHILSIEFDIDPIRIDPGS